MIRSNPVRPDSRVEKEAWSLIRAGYQVHILAWDRDGNHKEQDGQIQAAGCSIPITWLGYQANFGEGMKSIVPFLKFQMHMCRWLRRHMEEFDAVHACDFDTAFFSYHVVKRKHKKFIYDIFDFRYGEPKSLLQRVVRKSQLRLVDRADAVIICTEERKEQIQDAHPKRLAVIHNTPFQEQQQGEDALVFQSDSPKIKVAYVGILADERLLTAIGHYFSQHHEVEWHVGGFGGLKDYLEGLAKENENIFFYGRIPYHHTLELESRCDIMLAIYDPGIENCRRAAPNKFYESLMLGKPVIMVRNTGMSGVVEKHDIGALIDFSEQGFGQGLQELAARRLEWGAMAERMQKLYRDAYSWEKMDARLASLYHGLLP